MTSVSREEISHSLSFGGASPTSGGARGAMRYVDKPLVRPEWVTGLPRGEAFVRTRGENWKLRVPLLKPVPRAELEAVAGHFGLQTVLAELKEQAEAQATGSASDGRLSGKANGAPADEGSGPGRDEAPTGTERATGSGSSDGAERLGAAAEEAAAGEGAAVP